jgi:hypothetical protein
VALAGQRTLQRRPRHLQRCSNFAKCFGLSHLASSRERCRVDRTRPPPASPCCFDAYARRANALADRVALHLRRPRHYSEHDFRSRTTELEAIGDGDELATAAPELLDESKRVPDA